MICTLYNLTVTLINVYLGVDFTPDDFSESSAQESLSQSAAFLWLPMRASVSSGQQTPQLKKLSSSRVVFQTSQI